MTTGLFAILFAVSLFTGGFGYGNENTAPTANIVAQPTAQVAPVPAPTAPPAKPAAKVSAADLVEDSDPFLGDANAPLTIVEFSDYQCPFCKRFRDQTLDQLKSNYIDTGKVKFVYKDYPLSFHAEAQGSAEAALCAKDQDKYWEYHDTLFSDTQKWIGIGTSGFKLIASDLGLDESTFADCLDSGKYTQEVKDDFAAGQRAGVTGTPGFIVGNTLLSGAQPFSSFQAVIDAQLN